MLNDAKWYCNLIPVFGSILQTVGWTDAPKERWFPSDRRGAVLYSLIGYY